jgi:ketosteroid isomerase-like protein
MGSREGSSAAGVVRRGIDAFNRRDLEALLATLSVDVELVPFNAKLLGVTYHGEDGVRRWLDEVAEEWSEWKVDIEETRDVGDNVVVIGRLVGRTRGTEVEVDLPAAFLSTVVAGRLARMESFGDPVDALAAASNGAAP